jgi:acyl-coenzyme A synthetase/AMP-(fatty) acid ligase
MTGTVLSLVDRPSEAVLFRSPGRTIEAAEFLADVAALAGTLPAHAYVANLCQDRYWFAVGLAAALLRGQVSLLSGDPAPGILAGLRQDYPDCYLLTDAPTLPQALDPGSLPTHRVQTGAKRGSPTVADSCPAIPTRQPAVVVLTSGSTGRPIGTRKCWGELVARSRAAAERFALHEEAPATVLGTVPPGHMYGLETTILLPLHAGVASWCGPSFYPADIAAALDSLPGKRILVTTPLHLNALLRAPSPRRPPEQVISATAPLEQSLAASAEASWGAQVLEIFGATELGSIASRRTTAETDWTLYPGITLHAPEADETAPSLSAPWAEPRAMSDRVALTSGGRRFRLLGRNSDLVKLGGRRASLEGLTHMLAGIEGVKDAAFVATDDAARLAAFAVAPDHSVASLTEALRARIDPVFLPRPLVLVDALPRNALGKLPRAALLAALARRGA